jgi:hypothetical protein
MALFGHTPRFRQSPGTSWPRLYRIAYSWTHEPFIAQDLVQETIARALLHKNKISGHRMKLVFLIIAASISAPVSAAQQILGEFSTVVGSECISEIHFSKDGKGVFIDYCNGIDGVGYKTSFTWHAEKNIIHAKINGNDEAFIFQNKLSCSYIGKNGNSNGLIGMDLYFWKKPVKCK